MKTTALTITTAALCATATAAAIPHSAFRTPHSPPPNILFCIADDASYAHFGANGCAWVNTPAFDRIAREGIVFSRAYTPNAKCSPSRAIILTGRNSWQLEAAANFEGHRRQRHALPPRQRLHLRILHARTPRHPLARRH